MPKNSPLNIKMPSFLSAESQRDKDLADYESIINESRQLSQLPMYKGMGQRTKLADVGTFGLNEEDQGKFLAQREWERGAAERNQTQQGLNTLGVKAPTIGQQQPSWAAPTVYRTHKNLPDELKYLQGATLAGKRTGGGNIDQLTQELNAMTSGGFNFGNQAMQNAGQIRRMAPDLARYGVQSLSELRPVTIPGMGDVFYNTRTNAIVPVDFGSSMHGEGGTYYSLRNIGGRAVPVTRWSDTSDRDSIMGALQVLGAAATLGGLGPVLGGAMGLSGSMATGVGNAVLGAGIGGIQGAASGGNVLNGALIGGLGGVVASLNPAGMAGITNPTIQAGVNGAISGGLRGVIGGTDVAKGIVSGGFGGALGQAYGPLAAYGGSALVNMAFGNDAPSASQPAYNQPAAQGVMTAGNGSISPSILAQIREMQGKLQAQGYQAQGLTNLANWGQKNLGWV